jgi:uncharacterized RDD family membrane protein YckC
MDEKRIKITEIKEHYSVKRKEKNSAGELVEINKVLFKYKEVPYVTGWSRFGHFLLDRLFEYIFSFMVSFIIAFIILALAGENAVNNLNNIAYTLPLALILYPTYYLLSESLFQASPAKLILGRVVVDEYGDMPTLKQIVKRSFSRIVPFEFFSCFDSRGWHDQWSDTFVIRKKDLSELKDLAAKQPLVNQ